MGTPNRGHRVKGEQREDTGHRVYGMGHMGERGQRGVTVTHGHKTAGRRSHYMEKLKRGKCRKQNFKAILEIQNFIFMIYRYRTKGQLD